MYLKLITKKTTTPYEWIGTFGNAALYPQWLLTGFEQCCGVLKIFWKRLARHDHEYVDG